MKAIFPSSSGTASAAVAISTSGFVDYDFPFKKALTVDDVQTALNTTEQSLNSKITALNADATYLRKRAISLSLQMLAVNSSCCAGTPEVAMATHLGISVWCDPLARTSML